jgi:hypothetical protein
MIISVDLHGTITDRPKLFKKLNKFHIDIKEKHEIWIMSGPTEEQIRADLDRLEFEQGVHYTGIYSVVDYLKSKKEHMWQDERGSWWADDKVWWRSKSEMCTEYGIDLLIDDKEQYQEYFGTNHRTRFRLYKGFRALNGKNKEKIL